MGAKLERLGAELAKARKKKAEWDSRVKDLERRYREEENSEMNCLKCLRKIPHRSRKRFNL